ncbi:MULTISPECIES: glycosyltransferase family 4 protein [Marinobacter]|jgi:glycosyltransferase involved in cell wall biosynthesis|uniref:Glycosyltransferase n=3 Tax=Marinobacter TaxID=2742 RepID=A0A137SH85_9GAMM|nr:glycosyltransferase family 4 protein [Marinobacter excellens]KXO11772.1 Glycosyltransferase [Marinobacter excellens LAMA 842]
MDVLMTALQPGGGIKTFFRYIYGNEVFDHCTFTLFAPDHGLSEYLDNSLGESRIRVINSPERSHLFVKELRKVLGKRRYDLVHSHGFGAGLLTELSMTGLKQQHLMTAHDVFQASQFGGVAGSVKKIFMALLFKRMNAIHTVTNDATDNFHSFFPSVPERCLHPILHGVDTDYFSSGSGVDLRADLELEADLPLVGFFGRFMGQKGFRTLVDAIEQLKLTGFGRLPKVLTFGWGGYIREDYQYLEAKGLSEQFIQMPGTDNMPAMIKAVDMVVMPSRWEACGLLAMEVLSAGVPLLSTDCIGLREVVAGSPTRIFSPGSAEGLAAAIKAEIADPSRDRFLDYQPIAVERFHIGRPAAELRALYDELVGQTL